MSAESWPEAIREAVEDFGEIDVKKIMRGEFTTVPFCPSDDGPITNRDRIRKLNRFAGHYFNVAGHRVGGRDNTPEACEARYICWHVLKDCNGWSTERIGRAYKRDHSTVISGLRRYRDLCERIPGYQKISNTVYRHWQLLDV